MSESKILTPKVCCCDGRQWKHVSREQWGHSKVFLRTIFPNTNEIHDQRIINWNPRPETKTWWRQWSAGSATRLGMEAALALLFLGDGLLIYYHEQWLMDKNTLAFSALTILHWLINSFRWQRSTQIAGIPRSPSGSWPKQIFQNKSRSSPSGWLW